MTIKMLSDAADLTAGAIVIGALTDILPPIAAGLAIVWTLIRIYEWARVVVWKMPPR